MTRVVSVAFSRFPREVRTRREVAALVEAGMVVDNICLQGEEDLAKEVGKDGSIIYRIKLERKRGTRLRYMLEYWYFVSAAFFCLSWLHLRHRYRVVLVHNMPDILVFSALLPRLLGARVILDLHDPMPEIYMTKYGLSESSLVIRFLKVLERLSIEFAHMVITPNKAFRELFIARGCPPEKIHVVMNSPQEELFRRSGVAEGGQIKANRKSFELMYSGYIVEHNGLDVAVRAISLVRHEIPGIKFRIYGSGNFLEKVAADIEGLGLRDIVTCHGFVTLEEISRAIDNADLGIVPNRRTPFTELNFPQRILEYLCKGKPVIAPRTMGVVDYFDEDTLCYFEPGNHEDLARRILDLWKDPSLGQTLVRRGASVYRGIRWEIQKALLIRLVEGLQTGKS
ncbi:MAG TPA: glycosyltransferase family 4 protein [Balneolales bacterium]|nr:glycosyltransferase family 4 protein [Balneolales bacterium]